MTTTYGKTTTTGTAVGCSANYLWSMPFTTGSTSLVSTEMNIYCTNNISNAKIVVGIYSDNSGVPNTLVGQSTELTFKNTGANWINIDLSVNLESSTTYWMCFISSSALSLVYDSTGTTKYKFTTYSATMPSTFPSSPSSTARTYSFYINCEEGVSNSITISNPEEYRIFQRNENNQATVNVSGVYNGSPSAIEYRFANGSWTTLDSSPSAGSFSENITLATGQGNIEVRFANDTNIANSVSHISVGDIYVIAGQSNHAGRLTNLQQYTNNIYMPVMWKAVGTGNLDTWAELTDPTGDTTDDGSIWHALADIYITELNVPIGFILTSVGSTGLLVPSAQWGSSGAAFINSKQAVIESGVNGIKALLWLQGENEAEAGTVTQSQYQTALSAMLDAYQTAVSIPTLKMGVAQLITYSAGSVSRESLDAIRQAQAYCWDNDSDIFAAPVLCDIAGDGIHIVSDSDGLKLAQRWFHFLNLEFFSGTEGRSARYYNSYIVNSTKVRVLFTVANPPIVNATDATGWRIVDNSGTLTVSSTVAYGTNGIDITVNRTLVGDVEVSWGSFNDATNSTLKDSSTYGLPPEPFINQTITLFIYELVPTNITTTPAISTPTITQTHTLTNNAITAQQPTISTPTLSVAEITDELTSTDIIIQSPTISTATISQTHILTSTNILSSNPVISTATLTQTHILTSVNISSQPIVSQPTITEINETTDVLTSLDIETQQPTISTPTITQEHQLLSNDIEALQPVISTATISQIDNLIANSIILQQPIITEPVLTLVYNLTGLSIVCDNSIISSPAISQIHILTALNLAANPPTISTATLDYSAPTTPASRTMTIEAESRTMTIEAESRTMTIEAESRINTI